MSPDPPASQYSLTVPGGYNHQCIQKGKTMECDGAWDPNVPDMYSIEVDFLSPQTVCGLEYVSSGFVLAGPGGTIWDHVLEFQVLVSSDKLKYSAIAIFTPDRLFETAPSLLAFVNSVTVRYMKFTVLIPPRNTGEVNQPFAYLEFRYMQNCAPCPSGQFGCSNTGTRSASCIARVNQSLPPPPPPSNTTAASAKHMACNAISCGTSTCKFAHVYGFRCNAHIFVVRHPPTDFLHRFQV